jgi:YHS domain-containing protein
LSKNVKSKRWIQSVMGLVMAISLGGGMIGMTTEAHAAKPEIYTNRLSKAAVGGYDVVAYFTQAKPVKGQTQYKTTYKGAEWSCSSAENLAAFKAAPTRYAPQYGGYCAWAAAQGYTASGNPQNWDIVGGKLYLNYDATIQKRWRTNIQGFIRMANQNWPSILG